MKPIISGLAIALAIVALDLLAPVTAPVPTLGGADADNDGVADGGDNCPNWHNPSQVLPDWNVPAGDPDCDGFTSSGEGSIGTVPTEQCTTGPTVDAWPPDPVKTGSVNVTDVLGAKPHFGQPVPPASARYDLAVSGSINIGDILGFKPYFGKSCSASAPPCAGPGGGMSLPPDPGGSATPAPNAYSSQAILSSAYLGSANGSVIEFAMVPGQPDQAIVALQNGLIYRVSTSGSFAPALWGNVSSLLTSGGEQGLLSVAFSPDFEQDCRVYIYYTPGCGMPCEPTVLSRFSATPTDLDEGSEEVLLQIEEFANNHNGGHIAFDNAGYLYLSLGDGGGGGDPNEKGQALNTLLGKVIRIDVSGPSGYAIPPGNPFNDGGGPVREEIFAYGFRNPWRMAIDPVGNEPWLGDVGQANWEEVDRVVSGGNYGWDCYEGNAVYEPAGCPPSGFQFPRAVYDHTLGQAVTGGVIYRGDSVPELYGWYIYADFYSGRVWGVDTDSAAGPVQLFDATYNVSSFTLQPDGEVAIVSYGSGVHRLIKP